MKIVLRQINHKGTPFVLFFIFFAHSFFLAFSERKKRKDNDITDLRLTIIYFFNYAVSLYSGFETHSQVTSFSLRISLSPSLSSYISLSLPISLSISLSLSPSFFSLITAQLWTFLSLFLSIIFHKAKSFLGVLGFPQIQNTYGGITEHFRPGFSKT